MLSNGNRIIQNKPKVCNDSRAMPQTLSSSLADLAFPAHVAAYNGDLEHVKLLVEQGIVNVNERDERGATLAHKAAGQGHLEILQWLIEMGASMDLTTQSGETPKDVARRFGQLACLKVLGGGAEKAEVSGQQRPQTDSTRRRMTPKDEERARAKQKFDDMQKQLEIAKKNFRQLGGQFEEDQKRDTLEQDAQKSVLDLPLSLARIHLFLGASMSFKHNWNSNAWNVKNSNRN